MCLLSRWVVVSMAMILSVDTKCIILIIVLAASVLLSRVMLAVAIVDAGTQILPL